MSVPLMLIESMVLVSVPIVVMSLPIMAVLFWISRLIQPPEKRRTSSLVVAVVMTTLAAIAIIINILSSVFQLNPARSMCGKCKAHC
ncbi:hypothetical protein [Reticulibacter mediterranei]|uniref:hypothetical protein n=1 Tax=Reticulibacter mediterranei TaxID=2778369 RepID=UPI001C68AF6A|nr:hypothetical protein [Reticulibacter mediterranei]